VATVIFLSLCIGQRCAEPSAAGKMVKALMLIVTTSVLSDFRQNGMMGSEDQPTCGGRFQSEMWCCMIVALNLLVRTVRKPV